MSPIKAQPIKRTEAEMLAMLRRRHTESGGNGDAFAFVTHVKDAAGHSSRRTIDALAMSLWPSRGCLIDAFEVKCSRSDWLREMKDPAKADGFCEKADRFWLVVADETIVKDDELPPTWGLLVARGEGPKARLVSKVDAPMLREAPGEARGIRPLPPGVERSFLAALLRAAAKVGGALPAEIAEATASAQADAERMYAAQVQTWQTRAERAESAVSAFEKEAGVSIRDWQGRTKDAKAAGAAVRALVDGGQRMDRVRDDLTRFAGVQRRIAEQAEEAAAAISPSIGASQTSIDEPGRAAS